MLTPSRAAIHPEKKKRRYFCGATCDYYAVFRGFQFRHEYVQSCAISDARG